MRVHVYLVNKVMELPEFWRTVARNVVEHIKYMMSRRQRNASIRPVVVKATRATVQCSTCREVQVKRLAISGFINLQDPLSD